jgi:uncharacterized protein with FMN-binding domain
MVGLEHHLQLQVQVLLEQVVAVAVLNHHHLAVEQAVEVVAQAVQVE